MYNKMVSLSISPGVSALSLEKQEILRLYNETVRLYQEAKFDEAAEIFQKYQKCFSHSDLFPEFELVWDLSLIINEAAVFSEQIKHCQVTDCILEFENLLSNYMQILLKYSGTSDNFYGLLGCKEDYPIVGNSLHDFFDALPALEPVSIDTCTDIYSVPIVRDFFTAIVKTDLAKHDQNKWQVLQIYKDSNFYLFYFLSSLYQD